MSDTRQRRIERGLIIPDGCASEEVERLSIVFWDAERASDGFSSAWEYAPRSTREVIRAGIVAVLAAIEAEEGATPGMVESSRPLAVFIPPEYQVDWDRIREALEDDSI